MGLASRFNYYLTGSLRKSDGFDVSDDFDATPYQDEGLRRESDYDRRNFSMNLGLDLPKKSSVAPLVGYYDADRGLSPDAYEPTFRHRRWDDWRRTFVDVTGETELAESIHLRAKIYYDEFTNDMIFYDTGVVPEYQTFDRLRSFENNTLGGSLHMDWLVQDNVKLTTGGYYKEDSVSTRYQEGDPWEDDDLSATDLFLEVRWAILPTLAAFVQCTYSSGKPL